MTYDTRRTMLVRIQPLCRAWPYPLEQRATHLKPGANKATGKKSRIAGSTGIGRAGLALQGVRSAAVLAPAGGES